MATIIVKAEVEASPGLIADLLKKHAQKTADQEFPFPAGTLVTLNSDVNKALQGAEGMPALVIMTGKGSPLGIVAIHKVDGDITIAFLSAGQVEGPYIFPAD